MLTLLNLELFTLCRYFPLFSLWWKQRIFVEPSNRTMLVSYKRIHFNWKIRLQQIYYQTQNGKCNVRYYQTNFNCVEPKYFDNQTHFEWHRNYFNYLSGILQKFSERNHKFAAEPFAYYYNRLYFLHSHFVLQSIGLPNSE